jgi:hypothetical protein
VSQVPVQAFRHDPAAKDGVPAFYTQVVHAQRLPDLWFGEGQLRMR